MLNNARQFQLVNEQGWRIGFANLLQREYKRRWSARNWLIQSVIWLVLLNFALAMVLETESSILSIGMGVNIFTVMTGILGAIGIVLATQGAIVNEKKSGTAAWVLSKPVSRSAFIISKLVTIGGGFLIIVILLQGIIAYSQLSLFSETLMPFFPFLGGMALLALNVVFYLTLTLMMGTMFQGRSPILGIPMAFILIQPFLLDPLRGVAEWLPMLFPGALSEVARSVMLAESPPSSAWALSIITTSLLSVLFIYLAIRRFQREEL